MMPEVDPGMPSGAALLAGNCGTVQTWLRMSMVLKKMKPALLPCRYVNSSARKQHPLPCIYAIINMRPHALPQNELT